jgi:hypothetical protein
MTRRVVTSALVVLMAAVGAYAASKVDGRWQGSASGPYGTMTITYNLKAHGAMLTGTAGTPNGSVPITEGKVSGDKISFKTQYNGNVIDHVGTVSGNTMQLKVSSAFGDFNMTLKRMAKGKGIAR